MLKMKEDKHLGSAFFVPIIKLILIIYDMA